MTEPSALPFSDDKKSGLELKNNSGVQNDAIASLRTKSIFEPRTGFLARKGGSAEGSQRADTLLARLGLSRSRSGAAELIRTGKVTANGKLVAKPSEFVDEVAKIEISEKEFVGRGGKKLEGALSAFAIDVAGMVAVDIGASTGGFTESLLRRGAKKVYAIDVGTGQLASELLANEKVVSMEKTDIRNVTELPEKADIAVIDVSFISIKEIMEGVVNLLKEGGIIVALIKPQFETPPNFKNKLGVLRSKETTKLALASVLDYCFKHNLKIEGQIDSPILGKNGNAEYFLYLKV